jgi:hypothetical protein
MSRHGIQLSILTLLVGVFLLRESQREPLMWLDERFSDFIAAGASRGAQIAPLTLVELEPPAEGDAGPVRSPLEYALFFQSGQGFRPAVMATDEILQWDRAKLRPELIAKFPQYSQFLRDHILQAERPLLAAELGYPDDPGVLPPLEPVGVIRKVRGELNAIPEFTAIERQPAEEFRLSSSVGFVNLPQESARQRAVPMLFRYRGQVVPSFVLQAVLLWEKATLDDVAVEAGKKITVGEKLEIPIDAAGRMRVDFGVKVSRCGMDDLILAAELSETKRAEHAELFAGRIVLLSKARDEAPKLALGGGRTGSRGELLAAAIATVQQRSFVLRAPWWLDFLAVGLFSALAFFVPQWSRLRVTLAGAGVLAGIVIGGVALFGVAKLWMSVLVPAGLWVFLSAYPWVVPAPAKGAPRIENSAPDATAARPV